MIFFIVIDLFIKTSKCCARQLDFKQIMPKNEKQKNKLFLYCFVQKSFMVLRERGKRWKKNTYKEKKKKKEKEKKRKKKEKERKKKKSKNKNISSLIY